MLDEFEKMENLTSSFGWDQARKIYGTFLEPFGEGHIKTVEYGGESGPPIKCHNTIFICTTNLGQEEIIDFYRRNEERLNREGGMTDGDESFIQHKLGEEILMKKLKDFFKPKKLEVKVSTIYLL